MLFRIHDMKTNENLRILLGIFVAFSIVSFPFLGEAHEILVVTHEIPPATFLKDGKPTGFATEIVNAVLTKAGLSSEIKAYPWARAYHMAINLDNVLLYPVARTPKRESSFIWIGTVAPPMRTGLFWRTTRQDLSLTSLEGAKTYRVGVRRNSNFHEFLLKQGFIDEKNVFPVTTTEQNIQKLLKGRIDVILDVDILITTIMKSLKVPLDQIEPALILSEVEGYMVFSQNTADSTVLKVEAAYKEVHADGTIDEILEKYLGTAMLKGLGANQ